MTIRRIIDVFVWVFTLIALLSLSTPSNEQVSQKSAPFFILDAKQVGAENELIGWLDPKGQYAAARAREVEEIFLIVWETKSGKIIYTTRKKNRIPTVGFTWAGQKLVYIAWDGVTYAYELFPLEKRSKLKLKIFLFDPKTGQDKELKIPVLNSEKIFACGDDTVLLFDALANPPDYTTRISWYSISTEKKIQEVIVNVGADFLPSVWEANVIYCTSDHKRLWVKTYMEGPIRPFGHAPYPVLALIRIGEKPIFLMNPKKEWLVDYAGVLLFRVIKSYEKEEIIAAITMKRVSRDFEIEYFLVHFSQGKEVYRKRISGEALIKKGFKYFSFLLIGKDGKELLCEEHTRDISKSRLFWWNPESEKIKVISKGLKETRIIPISLEKVLLKHSEGLLQVE